MLLAVTIPVVARPFTPVTAVRPLAITALALLPGTAKVTVTPLTGLLPASRAVAVNTAPKAVPITVDWPEPLVTVSEVAAPAVFVMPKVAPAIFGAVARML